MADGMNAEAFLKVAHFLGKASGLSEEEVNAVLGGLLMFDEMMKAVVLKNERDGYYAGAVRKTCEESCPDFADCDMKGEGFKILEKTAFIFDTSEEAEEYAEEMRLRLKADFIQSMKQGIGR